MFAVVYLGGKQYRVREKDEIDVEKVDTEVGSNFKINEVLLMAEEDGSALKVGTPFVAGAHVECQVLETGKEEKMYIATYQSKKRTHRRQGHRQGFSTIKILKISAVAKKVSAKEEAPEKEEAAEEAPKKTVAKKPATKKAAK